MSDWPGSGWVTDTDTGHGRPGPGLAPLVAFGAALVLVADSLLLPWIYWGLGSGPSARVATGFTLYTLVQHNQAVDLGVGWALIVAAGFGLAVVGSGVELIVRPVLGWPRWVAAAGFGIAVIGCCLGLLAVAGGTGTTSGVLSSPLTTGLDVGFWMGLAGAAVGAVAAGTAVNSPPNPRHTPPPFARSPWGRPAPVPPPGFIPPQPDAWVDYIRRGEVPPGYVPPSYGPAVYPSPGFMTPAYVAPGYRRTAGGPSFAGPFEGEMPAADVVRAQMQAQGRIVVTDGPSVRTMLVEPGQRLLVGRDGEAEIRVADRKVSERHAFIERRGMGWAVQDVDAIRTTRLVDAWGTHSVVRGEREIPAGQLQIGDVTVTLFPVQPERPKPPVEEGAEAGDA